ncbi:LapA family protein [Cryobacterium sp. PH31-AA6]|uniref:LapA family protein n=1 Tax=Cryobacterium sp. PH31-AA6 TaxID=3046205 RepID=UPI0024BA0F89|nr:LapA family protein [Cryobacterium sp. PH31-AA6]MDJ0322194.1 LapA family protein [Cryobacterium sp. PH31-AA6]
MTRAGMIWVAVIAALVLLVLLIIFILQNEDRVTVHYLGAAGELSLGMALFIAAVAGGILVAISGAARILQLRSQRLKTQRRQRAGRPTGPAAPGSPAASGGREPKSRT